MALWDLLWGLANVQPRAQTHRLGCIVLLPGSEHAGSKRTSSGGNDEYASLFMGYTCLQDGTAQQPCCNSPLLTLSQYLESANHGRSGPSSAAQLSPKASGPLPVDSKAEVHETRSPLQALATLPASFPWCLPWVSC